MRWSEERAAQLGRLHAKDFSFEQIAIELGVSRGAVASKVAQMGLAGRPRGARSKPQLPKRRAISKLNAPHPEPTIIIDQQSDAPVALLDLESHHCRWPVRDAPSYLFCADTKFDGSSYCRHHFGISRRV